MISVRDILFGYPRKRREDGRGMISHGITLIIRVRAVRWSLERSKSIGMISSGPFIRTGMEQMVVSPSLCSSRPNCEGVQDMTHE